MEVPNAVEGFNDSFALERYVRSANTDQSALTVFDHGYDADAGWTGRVFLNSPGINARAGQFLEKRLTFGVLADSPDDARWNAKTCQHYGRIGGRASEGPGAAFGGVVPTGLWKRAESYEKITVDIAKDSSLRAFRQNDRSSSGGSVNEVGNLRPIKRAHHSIASAGFLLGFYDEPSTLRLARSFGLGRFR